MGGEKRRRRRRCNVGDWESSLCLDWQISTCLFWSLVVFFVLLGLFCVVRVVCLCASSFPLISVISVPSMCSECELTVKEAAVKATRKAIQ